MQNIYIVINKIENRTGLSFRFVGMTSAFLGFPIANPSFIERREIPFHNQNMARIRRYCGNYILETSGDRLKEYCGSYLYELDGNRVRRYCGSYLYEIDGDRIKQYCGSYLLQVEGNRIRRYCGSYIAEIDGNRIKQYCGPYLYEIEGFLSHKELMMVIAVLFA